MFSWLVSVTNHYILETKVSWVHIVSTEGAVNRGSGSKLHVWTQIVATFLAKVASATTSSRFNSDSVT